MRHPRGATLAESLVAMLVLGSVIGMVFLIFELGSRAWRTTTVEADLRSEFGVLVAKVSRDAERSSQESLSVEGEGFGLLSALDDNGQFVLGSRGQPVWQRYLVYYRDAADQVLRQEVLITPTETAIPIESYDDGSGARPLASRYDGSGRVVARGVKILTPTLADPGRLNLQVRMEKPQPKGRQPARLHVETGFFVRNR